MKKLILLSFFVISLSAYQTQQNQKTEPITKIQFKNFIIKINAKSSAVHGGYASSDTPTYERIDEILNDLEECDSNALSNSKGCSLLASHLKYLLMIADHYKVNDPESIETSNRFNNKIRNIDEQIYAPHALNYFDEWTEDDVALEIGLTKQTISSPFSLEELAENGFFNDDLFIKGYLRNKCQRFSHKSGFFEGWFFQCKNNVLNDLTQTQHKLEHHTFLYPWQFEQKKQKTRLLKKLEKTIENVTMRIQEADSE